MDCIASSFASSFYSFLGRGDWLDVELADVCVVVVGPDIGLVVVGVAIVGLDVGLGLLFLGSITIARTKSLVRKDILNTLNVLILLSLKSQVGNLIEIPRE